MDNENINQIDIPYQQLLHTSNYIVDESVIKNEQKYEQRKIINKYQQYYLLPCFIILMIIFIIYIFKVPSHVFNITLIIGVSLCVILFIIYVYKSYKLLKQ